MNLVFFNNILFIDHLLLNWVEKIILDVPCMK